MSYLNKAGLCGNPTEMTKSTNTKNNNEYKGEYNIMADFILRTYNDSLRYPIPEYVIDRILARQRTAYTLSGSTEAPIWKYFESKWIDCETPASLEAFLQPVRTKIRTKYWGPQGRPLAKDAQEMIAPYLEHHEIADIRQFITPCSEVLLRAFFAPLREYLQKQLKEFGTLSNDPRYVYNKMLRKPKSNSGYRWFSTTDSRDPRYIIESLRMVSSWEKPDPMIHWYRDMRQKYRSIFGGSLQHLAMYETHLRKILTVGLKHVNNVYYHSEFDEAIEISKFIMTADYKRLPRRAICCDYESMDTCCSRKLCMDVFTLVLDLCDIPQEKQTDAIAALEFFFRSPVLGIDGRLYMDIQAVLSGIGPTNGIENLINATVQLISLARAVADDPNKIPLFTLRVMGDDSALLIACDDIDTVTVRFLSEFEVVTSALGLRIQREKQDVSDDVYCFCRRYYPLHMNMRGFKIVPTVMTLPGKTKSREVHVPWPIYPFDYAMNSIRYPEDMPKWDAPSVLPDVACSELTRFFALIDNAWGDPKTVPILNNFMMKNNLYSKVPEIVYQVKHGNETRPIDWRVKVYGADGWTPDTSPSLRYIESIYNKRFSQSNTET